MMGVHLTHRPQPRIAEESQCGCDFVGICPLERFRRPGLGCEFAVAVCMWATSCYRDCVRFAGRFGWLPSANHSRGCLV